MLICYCHSQVLELCNISKGFISCPHIMVLLCILVTGTKKRRMTNLHNKELHNLYASPDIAKVIKWRRMRQVGQGKMKTSCTILVGKLQGKTPLGKSRRRWEENIIMNLRELWVVKPEDNDMNLHGRENPKSRIGDTRCEGWSRFIWFSIGSVTGSCEHGNDS